MTKRFAGSVCALVVVGLLACAGCGRFRGIPGHGGGKRFFIEQELVAASARAAAKDINVSALKGRRCAVYITTMGDQGAGNIIGGKYSWDSLLRGSYDISPTQYTDNKLPTGIAFPQDSDVFTRGWGLSVGSGAEAVWPGILRSEAFINPLDVMFLNAVIREAFALKGLVLVTPAEANVDIYVTVDAFGTCRDRFEMHVYNKEILKAKTSLSVTAFERMTRKVILRPTTTAFEGIYTEEFIFWCGPISESKIVRRSDRHLVDYRDIAGAVGSPGAMRPKTGRRDRTRPKTLTKPLGKPDPNRPEDQPKPR